MLTTLPDLVLSPFAIPTTTFEKDCTLILTTIV